MFGVAKKCNGFSLEVVGPPSLEIFKQKLKTTCEVCYNDDYFSVFLSQ